MPKAARCSPIARLRPLCPFVVAGSARRDEPNRNQEPTWGRIGRRTVLLVSAPPAATSQSCPHDNYDVPARLGRRCASAVFSTDRCFEVPFRSERLPGEPNQFGTACRNARALALQRREAKR